MEREPLTKDEMPTHWNSPELLPVVGPQLWVLVPRVRLLSQDDVPYLEGTVTKAVKARRTAHIQSRGDQLEYQLEGSDVTIKGRFHWAYP